MADKREMFRSGWLSVGSSLSATRTRFGLLVPLVPLITGMTAVVVILGAWFTIHGTPGDAYNYLAAGERLNSGHLLYAITAGDRPVDIRPPFWTVPLLSPPFIAVLWRPLAALPNDLGITIWWGMSMAVVVATLGWMALHRPVLIGLALTALCVPVAYELGIGNVNAFLFAGAVASWELWRRGRFSSAAAIIGVMIALKLTPAVFGIWLLSTSPRRQAFLALSVAVGICTVVGIVGAGPASTLDYLGVISSTERGGASPLSLGGLTGISWLPSAFGLGSCICTWALRARPGMSFAAATLGWVFGSPAVYINTFAELIATAAPLVTPHRFHGPGVQALRGHARTRRDG